MGLGTWDRIPVMERDPRPTVRDWHVPGDDRGGIYIYIYIYINNISILSK
jgi:hypothetical protein